MIPTAAVSLLVVACSLCSTVVTAAMLSRLWGFLRAPRFQVKLGSVLVMRTVFFITAAQLLSSLVNATQFFPKAVGMAPPWANDTRLCTVLGLLWQLGFVAEFAWALLLVWMVVMLMRGYSSAFLDRTHQLQHGVVWCFACALTLAPIFSHDYGFVDEQCWLVEGPHLTLFYVVFFLCIVCCVAAIVLAACSKHAATRSSSFAGFLLYFLVIWIFPVLNRIFHLAGCPLPAWMMSVELVVESADGMGSFLVWVSLLRHPQTAPNLIVSDSLLSSPALDGTSSSTQLARRFISPARSDLGEGAVDG